MATNIVWSENNGEAAVREIEKGATEVVLDFTSVRRVDGGALRSLGQVAAVSGARNVKVSLRGVNVDVYKVLKLMKLDSRFAFLN